MKRLLLLKSLLLLCALVVGTSAWATDEYSYTFNASSGISRDDNTLSSMTWTLATDPSDAYLANEASGLHIGSSSKGVKTITLSSSSFSGVISKVVVNTKGNGSSGTVGVTVNGTAYTAKNSKNSIGSTSADLEFTGSQSGEIVITLGYPSKQSKNIYVSRIDVTYNYTAPTAALDHISLSGTYPTSFFVGDGFSHDGMTVTAHYSDASTLDVTGSASFTGYNMSSAGDQTVTVSYEESSVEKTTTYDITVSPVPPVVLTLDFATNILGLPVGSKDKETESTGYTYGGYTYTLAAPEGFYYLETTTPSTYKCLLMGKNGATLTFPAFPFKVKMIKVYGTPGASTGVKQNIFVGDDPISTETTGAKDVTNVYRIPSAYQAIGTVYVLKVTSSANTQISKIEILGDGEAVAVSAVGLATFASDNKLDFTNVPDLEAYIAKEAAGVITLKQVNKVDAGTGVLLRALNGTTAFGVPVTTADADDATGNMFVRGNNAAVATSEGGNYNWILSKKGEVIGFYHANGNTVASNRAYLQTTTASARISLDFDDEDVTAISNVNRETITNNGYFNLAGQRVANPTKGLYIVNGKKVVIK